MILFGQGTGNSMFALAGTPSIAHPHNVLVESLYDNGLVGLSVLLFALTWPVVMVVRALTRGRRAAMATADLRLVAASLGLYIFAVAGAQFSGDLGSNIWLPAFGVVLVTLARDLTTTEHPEGTNGVVCA